MPDEQVRQDDDLSARSSKCDIDQQRIDVEARGGHVSQVVKAKEKPSEIVDYAGRDGDICALRVRSGARVNSDPAIEPADPSQP